jgi:hypothetical protein
MHTWTEGDIELRCSPKDLLGSFETDMTLQSHSKLDKTGLRYFPMELCRHTGWISGAVTLTSCWIRGGCLV